MGIKYKILTTEEPDTLNRVVQRYLDDGWNLHGNPFLGRGCQIHQAVIKPEPKGPAGFPCILSRCSHYAEEGSTYCRVHRPDFGSGK